MFYTDYHTHTLCSPDSNATLDSMAEAAIRVGLSELCVTDHCDLRDPFANRISDYDWNPALSQYESARFKCRHSLALKFGIELGSPHVCPEDARRILSIPQLDFIIGSNHNWSEKHGGGDFYFTKYSSLSLCYQALDDYFEGLDAIASLPDCYDVIGHIIYPLRYMCGRDGQSATLEAYTDRIDALLNKVISLGRGIEINTYRGKTVEDWSPILKRYLELGGEIITVGSDAHAPQDIGGGVKEAYALLNSIGFRYICTYEKRKPSFVAI